MLAVDAPGQHATDRSSLVDVPRRRRSPGFALGSFIACVQRNREWIDQALEMADASIAFPQRLRLRQSRPIFAVPFSAPASTCNVPVMSPHNFLTIIDRRPVAIFVRHAAYDPVIMSVEQYRAFVGIWRSLWPRAFVAPARITTDRSVIRLEIRKDFLQRVAAVEPAAVALLQASAATNDGDWGGPDYPEVQVEPDHLKPFLGQLASLMSKY